MKDVTIVNLIIPFDQNKVVPRGTLILAAVLKRKGYSVDLRDYQVCQKKNPFDIDCLAHFISHKSAPIIGISCYANALPFVVLAIKRIKEKNPEKIVVLGGCGPSEVSSELVENFPFIDVVVKGEGEETIAELVDCIAMKKPLNGIKGISFRQDGRVINNPARQRVDLNLLPLPAYDEIDLKRYTSLGIETARGCPYNCTFCCLGKFWDNKYMTRDIDRVLDELGFISKIYSSEINILDDTFVVDRERVLDFCGRLKKESLDCKWGFYGRVNLLDAGLMEKISKANGKRVFMGVESGSDQVLKSIRKGYVSAQATKAVLKARDYFDQITCSYIYGFPFETMKDFCETAVQAKFFESKGAKIEWNLLTPLKSSELYSQSAQLLVFDQDINPSHCKPFELTKEIINFLKHYKDIFPAFYHYQSIDLLQKIAVIRRFKYEMKVRQAGK